MLATLNSSQIVDEIVKDTVKDNDPHDAVQISPDIVLASRPAGAAPTLAPEIASRPEPKIEPKTEPKIDLKIDPRFAPAPKPNPQPNFVSASEPQAAAPSVDTAVRVAAGDARSRQKRSAAGKWLRGAFVTFLFAGGSAAATVAWEKHGDTARQMLAQWTPVLASLLPETSQTPPVAAAQASPPAAEAAPDQTADQPATPTPPAAQDAVAAPAPAAAQADAAQSNAVQSVQSMTRDLAAMAQQIEQLKANIAELKAGQEQMAREMTKPAAPKPVANARPIDPHARVAAMPPRPAAPPVRKPRPAVTQTYMPAYAPASLAPPPPSQATAVPPPPSATQAVADDDGPVVRPPMPLR